MSNNAEIDAWREYESIKVLIYEHWRLPFPDGTNAIKAQDAYLNKFEELKAKAVNIGTTKLKMDKEMVLADIRKVRLAATKQDVKDSKLYGPSSKS